MQSNLGKIVRLNDDGRPAAGNPFAAQGGVAAQIWSLGHRNPLGMAFDEHGQLWVVEMGQKGAMNSIGLSKVRIMDIPWFPMAIIIQVCQYLTMPPDLNLRHQRSVGRL
jgi:secreted PhoX family phosphatase